MSRLEHLNYILFNYHHASFWIIYSSYEMLENKLRGIYLSLSLSRGATS